MTFDSISWGSPDWLLPAAALVAAALGALLLGYGRAPGSPLLRSVAGVLKAAGVLLLGLCLLEPLMHGRRPRPGANLFVILADNSQSLRVRETGDERTRGDRMRDLLVPDAPWRARLGQDFDVRKYLFDGRVRAVDEFVELTLEGASSALGACLDTVAGRYRGRPVAGVLLLTDGIATDLEERELDPSKLPPIYPVLIGGEKPPRDIAVQRVTVSQSPFESAPITLGAEISEHGYDGKEIVTRVLDAAGQEIERDVQVAGGSGRLAARFQLRPEGAGVHFYRIRTSVASELDAAGEPRESSEATIANNDRLVAVNRTRGPYRVLYVSGRPNWEFKFLRRALEADEEVELLGLIRIAKREPKFEYRSRYGESTNPLFRGFGNEENEDAERYDQPVLLRVGTTDEEELRDGFPRAAKELYRYHAVILDDVEAGYFTQDQMTLVRTFVSRRGGGFLMLGGQESFAKGKYGRTPIEELLPVYLDPLPAPPAGAEFRISLTREGWIQPWTRLRDTEESEQRRLDEMPTFRTLNPSKSIKPGGAVLAMASDGFGRAYPALVAQPFGKGRTGALLLGELWRWNLRRESPEDEDPAKAWRQTVRWLVSDVPRRVEAEVSPESTGPSLRLAVRVRDELYEPLDNASISIEVTDPEGNTFELAPEPSLREAGLHEATYTSRRAGGYRARVRVQGPDGSEVGDDERGWTADPAASEYRRLEPDGALLERLARGSGGEMVAAAGLESFVAGLPDRRIPITDPWVHPLWHRWWVWLLIVLCLAGEWGLRRWKGLP